MKTFTKFCLLAFVIGFSVSLTAQKLPDNQTGNTAPDKLELIRQLHGPTAQVPLAPNGSKAIGDDCTNPEIINITSGNGLPLPLNNQTTTGRGNNYENTCLNDFDGGEDMIIELNLAFDTTLTFTIDPKGTPFSGMALNEDCYDNPTATCLAVSTDTYGDGMEHGFAIALEAGTYYLIIDSWPNVKSFSIPDFNLVIAATTVVPNDDCANAIAVGEVNGKYFSTLEATPSVWPLDGKYDIWYSYTASFTGNATVDVCDSDFDTYLEVYDACNGALLDFNDDACDLQSKVTLPVTNGSEYVVRVAGFDNETGEGFLSIYEETTCTLPPVGTAEGEVCGDFDNDGCNIDPPAFFTVADGDLIFGNLSAENNERDTDWFELTIGAISSVKLSVKAEQATTFGLVMQAELGVPGCDNLGNYFTHYKNLPACLEDSIEFMNLPAGTYYFMVAPTSYNGHPCPGYNYYAEFVVEANAVGTISGVVTDGLAGINGVTVSADVFSTTTDALGNYSFDIPAGTYAVTASGFGVGYSTSTATGVVVTDGNITMQDFELNDKRPTLTAASDPAYGYVELDWAPAAKKQEKGTDVVMGEVESNNDYLPSTTMDLDFTLTAYAPENPAGFQDWGAYFEIELPAGFTIVSATDFPLADGTTLPATIDGQKVYWETGLEPFWKDNIPMHFIDFSINVTTAAIVGPQVAGYYFMSDGTTGDPNDFNGYVTIYENGGDYVPTFNVYRMLDNGAPGYEFIWLLKGTPETGMFDVIHDGNWCYYVTQIMLDGTESAPSDTVCVEVVSGCGDAIDYGVPNDPAVDAETLVAEQLQWFTVELLNDMDIFVSTCGSDFDTYIALYDDCENVPNFPAVIPDGAIGFAYDGCNNGAAASGFCDLEAGVYYIAVGGENGEFGNININITQVQCLTIQKDWSGFSIYMEPAPSTAIEDVLAGLSENMIITVRQQPPLGVWWVPQNINTIGDITPILGYKSKMIVKDSCIVTGIETTNKTVNIPKGSSYLPVRVPYEVATSDFADAVGSNLLFLHNIFTTDTWWPNGGIYTLLNLKPDEAYLLNMYNADTYTYPPFDAKSSKSSGATKPYKGENLTWNEVENTGISHFISIEATVLESLELDDQIGVFNTEGLCVGFLEVTTQDNNILLLAFGDEMILTPNVVDGLTEGELMSYRLYRPSTEQEFVATVTYNTSMPHHNGLFAVEGLSMISEMKLSAVAIGEKTLESVAIYPNPTTGQLTIKGLDKNATLTITNVKGQVIYRGVIAESTTINLSTQPKGIYFVQLVNEESTRIQKVILE
ncbi:MAG TPA: T9SS type A sorting domain-containing protein [Bacteroidales bacterium]|nr:T9SS type A sorting domain-containing protein [Bacteroidales bacterium]